MLSGLNLCRALVGWGGGLMTFGTVGWLCGVGFALFLFYFVVLVLVLV